MNELVEGRAMEAMPGEALDLARDRERKHGRKGKKKTRKTMVNSMQRENAKITIDKRVNENMYVFTVELIVKTTNGLSESTRVNVGVVTKTHSHSRNLSDIVSVSAVEFQVHELGPVLEHDSPIVPLDPRPSHVVVTPFR